MRSRRSSWSLALLSVSCLTFLAASCAKAPATDAPELPSGSEDNGTSDGGTGAAGGSDGGTLDGGSTSTPAACNPINQSGCSDATSQCGLAGSKFGCVSPGTVAIGSACTTSNAGDNCVAGAVCINPPGSGGYKCHKVCSPNDASTCPSDSQCALKLAWNGGSAAGGETFDICVQKGSTCSPLAQNCSDAQLGCYSTSAGNQCLTPGTVADGTPCVSANDCIKGSTCIGFGGTLKCSKICTLPANPDAGPLTDAGTPISCATGTCRAVAEETFGVCQ